MAEQTTDIKAQRIEYPNKVRGDLYTSANANEVKAAVNGNADLIEELGRRVKENKGTTESLIKAVSNLREETKTTMVTQTETVVSIKPNKLYIWDNADSLHISLSPGDGGIMNEYMLQFTVSGNDFVLEFLEEVRWVDEPDFAAGNTYMVSIVNNLAIGAEWEAARL